MFVCGKSTLVKILYGLLKSDEGEITFNNSPLKVQSPSEARKNKIGMVFQHFSLFDSLTVRENLILGIDQNMSFSNLQEKVNEISNRYKLPLDLDAPINTLSAGQKQRVEIVRILLQEKKSVAAETEKLCTFAQEPWVEIGRASCRERV